MQQNNRTGILLINLGTPNDPSITSVRKYLREFLSDPRVIELPTLPRWLLLNLVILPFRAKKSAKAYKAIWDANGSPLLINSLAIQQKLQATLGDSYKVVLGMRYGEPSIKNAVRDLQLSAVTNIIVVPLFPQYASAVTGSALQIVLQMVAQQKIITPIKIITEFFKHEAYIQALAVSIAPYIMKQYDFLLMSYHGLPERQMINPGVSCYRTQCLQTSKLLAEHLQLPDNKWDVSFQSRLGKLPWNKPYTDQMLVDLRQRGIKNLLVCCPSFVADCLETLEEIGIRASVEWLKLGGTNLELIPCLNNQQQWIDALKTISLH